MRQFQSNKGLTVDGIVGPQTWGSLSPYLTATAAETTYAWYACTAAVMTVASTLPAGCTAIASSNATTYTLAAAEAATFVSFAVTIKNSGGTETRWTASTGAVAP